MTLKKWVSTCKGRVSGDSTKRLSGQHGKLKSKISEREGSCNNKDQSMGFE